MCIFYMYEPGERVNNTHQMLMLVTPSGSEISDLGFVQGVMCIILLHLLLCYLTCYKKRILILQFQRHQEMEIFSKEKKMSYGLS